MRLPLEWIAGYVDIEETPEELAERLDLTGTAVEAVHRDAPGFEGVVVGRVLSVEAHPNADRLTYDEVDVGTHSARIVCGAPNVRPGMTVPVALPGAVLPNGMVIERRTVRGLVSEGMMCAEDELGLGEDHSGIMVLDERHAPGTPVADALGLGRPVLELEVTPNRPDCLSIQGLAREVGAVLGRPVRHPDETRGGAGGDATGGADDGSGPVAADLVSVDIEDPDDCPRYVAMVIDGLVVGPSPRWLQDRLVSMGARPINNLVDVTNYVMFEMGQPLHAFDYGKVADGHIIIRRAAEGETLTTLDGVQRVLDPGMLVIADPDGPVALAGVMGGADTEVGESTTRVLLESANFHPPLIMRTSRGLGLLSEASSRFEKGVDPNGALRAAERAAALMAEIGGGRVVAGAVDAYPKRIDPWELTLRPVRANAVLGTDLGEKTMSDHLERLGCEVELVSARPGGPALAVTVPTYRPDLVREIDLVEEVARLVGYNEIPTTLPAGAGRIGRLTRRQRVERELYQAMRAAGVNEAVSMGFVDPAEISALRWPLSAEAGAVVLKNPVAADQSALRPTLLIELLRAVRHNQSVGERQIALYELGRVWPGGFDEEGIPVEEQRVAVVLCGGRVGREWHSAGRPYDIHDLVGVVEDMRDALWLDGSELARVDHPSLMPGRALELRLGGAVAGWAGTLHPDVAAAFDVDGPVFVAEVRFDALVEGASDERDFVEPARFPAVERDLAVVVRESVLVGDLVATALAAGAPLLGRARVFDVYRGEGVPSGSKSVGLELHYRAPDRTLTDREADEAHSAVEAALKERHGATRR